MAHNLTIDRFGRAEMFYINESPWHGLGTKLEKVATSKEALVAASLDWAVRMEPIFLGNGRRVDEFRATVRADTGEALSIVGTRYQPIQNVEAFRFLDALVGEAKAMYHTAGNLRGGRKVWIQARLPKELVIVPGDVAEKFLLLVNSHDGESAMVCRFVATRVVCQNTLAAALREHGASRQVSVRHTRSATERVDEARRVLGLSLKYFDVFGQRCQAMSAKKLTQRMLHEYFSMVVPTPEPGRDSSQVRRIHQALAHLFEEGRGNERRQVRGTLWAAYNSVTEYVDHIRGVRKDGTPRGNWAESALFGSGDALKQRAYLAAVALVDEGVASRFWRRLRGTTPQAV